MQHDVVMTDDICAYAYTCYSPKAHVQLGNEKGRLRKQSRAKVARA